MMSNVLSARDQLGIWVGDILFLALSFLGLSIASRQAGRQGTGNEASTHEP